MLGRTAELRELSVARTTGDHTGVICAPNGLAGRLWEGFMAGGGGVVFRNVRVFDGVSDRLSGPSDVVVSGNVIASVAPHSPAGEADPDRQVIDGGGRVLMPGLIDVHTHLAFATIPLSAATAVGADYVAIRGSVTARDMLMRG